MSTPTIDTTMAKPVASIVMPCFNVAETLTPQLERLLPQIDLVGAELVLVDNNSTDGTADLLADLRDRPNVVVGRATEGQSVAYARNAGVELASADRFLFCDADDIVCDDWVLDMYSGLDSSDVVTGVLDATTLNSAEEQSGRGDHSGPASFYGLFPLAHGGNMGVTRKAWSEIGPLDETLGSVEDMEWSLRANAHGHDIVRIPTARIHYRYRSTARDLWRQGLIYGTYRPEIARRVHSTLGVRVRRFAGAKSWAWLMVNSGRILTPKGRAQLAWVAGNRLGHVIGSVRSRFMVL